MDECLLFNKRNGDNFPGEKSLMKFSGVSFFSRIREKYASNLVLVLESEGLSLLLTTILAQFLPSPEIH